MAFVKREDIPGFSLGSEIYDSYSVRNDRHENINIPPTLLPSNGGGVNNYPAPPSHQPFQREINLEEFGSRSDLFPFPLPIKTEIDDSNLWVPNESDRTQNQNHAVPSSTDSMATHHNSNQIFNHAFLSQNIHGASNFHQILPLNFYERHQAITNSFLSYSQANNVNNNSLEHNFRPQDHTVSNLTSKEFSTSKRKDSQNQFMKNVYPRPFPLETSGKLHNDIQRDAQLPIYETAENLHKNVDLLSKEDVNKKNYDDTKLELKSEGVKSPDSIHSQNSSSYFPPNVSGNKCDSKNMSNNEMDYSDTNLNERLANPSYTYDPNCLKNENSNNLPIGNDSGKGKYSCEGCAYSCQSPAILKIHERTHSGEKPFSCNFCQYKSGQKTNVAKHILVHIKEKPYRCQYCEYRCAQKNNLVVHERTHTGEKPFVCTFCEYKTVQKPNLVKHMYLHTNQKPFACDVCEYRCVQKTNLMKHKQKHSSEKPFQCTDCDYKSTQKVNLNKHKFLHDKQKPFLCELCPYKCVQKCNLAKHRSTKHGLPPTQDVGINYSNTVSYENDNRDVTANLNSFESHKTDDTRCAPSLSIPNEVNEVS